MNTYIITKIITAILSLLCLFSVSPNSNFELPPIYDPIPAVEETDETANYNDIPEFINDEDVDINAN